MNITNSLSIHSSTLQSVSQSVGLSVILSFSPSVNRKLQQTKQQNKNTPNTVSSLFSAKALMTSKKGEVESVIIINVAGL